MQPLQNLCPQVVCTGSRSPKRQIGHSYLLSKGGSKYSSYPSDLGSSYDEKSLLANELTGLGSNDTSRKSDDCSSRRKERVILDPHFSCFVDINLCNELLEHIFLGTVPYPMIPYATYHVPYFKAIIGICIAWYKHERGWENSRQLYKPETKSRVCITVENSPNPSSVYIRQCKHRKKVFYYFYKITFLRKKRKTLCYDTD